MTVTRNMQVTVKKGTNPSMKTLDCHLLIKKDGERTTLSSKGKRLLVHFPFRWRVSVRLQPYS